MSQDKSSKIINFFACKLVKINTGILQSMFLSSKIFIFYACGPKLKQIPDYSDRITGYIILVLQPS
jgi:hypothetical protein